MCSYLGIEAREGRSVDDLRRLGDFDRVLQFVSQDCQLMMGRYSRHSG